ncbi:voltage-dependent calcium channel subunit alpha-2/delta-3 [Bradysia coprophila]|uniref:voltage-dependent calcium channel subunit alpha-2/delta-3 n=1 Tax=Bradysia coprophila TaxID=38358 RepID=UPI00187DB283|nr:voltage-dependent calcium channel subunit alpha-2/delta-3 [Bradysia coprophila]
MVINREKFYVNHPLILLACILCIGLLQTAETSKEAEIVATWAQEFGDELWQMGQKMTKSNEIKMKYKQYNARVEQKGNDTLIKSIVDNLGRMLQRKIDAVRCILNTAEESAEKFDFNKSDHKNYTYYSSKYSIIEDLEGNLTREFVESLPEIVQKDGQYFQNLSLYRDTHFYNISVNTSHSSVHVPTNVYHRSREVLETIMWSEALDQVFLQNYQSDPALSWQYFGSDTGIMRHFPAKRWESHGVDVYDCRKRSWYIETATCSKDIVILLDNSGSMTGFRNFIAQLTIKSILDTFSNNDFTNILVYSKNVTTLVPCFDNTLVQATPENIAVFNAAVKKLKPEGSADVGLAFIDAFELLQRYRDDRKCSESKAGCNQAIMLITDGVPGNATEIFDKYNWIENGNFTKIPVRIFTYLVGKEVTNVREIQWMACLNRGHYSHIETLDQVQGEVLKYVNVIATPLVLQGTDHPPTWTHAFKDFFSDDDDSDENDDKARPDKPARLMIAVGVPAFDRKSNYENGTLKKARLLGVASTDVPVEDINKLTLPYKLGVNAYSFIVSNNGYVLLHPDLRPVDQGQLKPNYNSIDLTEVEQFEESTDPRKPGKVLMKLREDLVNNVEGKMLNISVKFHYDNMRRISQETYDYYFAPLPNTPFSLGLAIPSGYGNTWIKVGDEVKRNLHLGVNMSRFFMGENFKVHPEWVYCKYHYLEGHEFDTPEEELLHFLNKLSEPNWKWSQQYEVEPKYQHDGIPDDEPDCGRKTLDDDAYYCNKELVQLLIFDAKVTNASYGQWEFESESDRELFLRFNATLRFVATNSGLTRWQFILEEEIEVDTDIEFGDYHKFAIDETWYKAAILQHRIDPLSFVYSVPHVSDDPENEELKVTASHAIFPRDGGLEAPGLVVGFQFSHALMHKRFMEITSKADCNGCLRTCDDAMQECYVLDNNGYIVLSKTENLTGRFFGEIDGPVMQSMEELNIFKKITVYDLQALCCDVLEKKSDSDSLWNPFQLVLYAIKWIAMELVVQWSRLHMLVEGVPLDYGDENDYSGVGTQTPKPIATDDGKVVREPEIKKEKIYRACDKKSDLFILQQNLFIQGGNVLPSYGKTSYSRPYFFKRIPYSNLILVVVNHEHQSGNQYLTASPVILDYEHAVFPCYKLSMNSYERRRLDECFTEHPDEANVTQCGLAPSTFTYATVVWTFLFCIFRQIF